MPATKPADHGRKSDLAMIHIAKKFLADKKGFADADYRLLLSERFGVLSAAALGPVQRQALLREFESRGWKRDWAGRRKAKGKTFLEARGKDSAQLRKIRAMLAEAGRSHAYGDALAKRLCDVDRPEWCKPDQLTKIIAALVYDAERRAGK